MNCFCFASSQFSPRTYRKTFPGVSKSPLLNVGVPSFVAALEEEYPAALDVALNRIEGIGADPDSDDTRGDDDDDGDEVRFPILL